MEFVFVRISQLFPTERLEALWCGTSEGLQAVRSNLYELYCQTFSFFFFFPVEQTTSGIGHRVQVVFFGLATNALNVRSVFVRRMAINDIVQYTSVLPPTFYYCLPYSCMT